MISESGVGLDSRTLRSTVTDKFALPKYCMYYKYDALPIDLIGQTTFKLTNIIHQTTSFLC